MRKSVLLAFPHDAVPIDHLAADVMRLKMIKNYQGELKVERATLESKVKRALGDAEVGLILDEPAVSYRRSMRMSVSESLLKSQFPTVAAAVLTTSEVRTFLVLG